MTEYLLTVKTRRSRGRPRQDTYSDSGTRELSNKRAPLKKHLKGKLLPFQKDEAFDSPLALALALNLITSEQYHTGASYALLAHKARRSMGIRSNISAMRSTPTPRDKHLIHRTITDGYEQESLEKRWSQLSQKLSQRKCKNLSYKQIMDALTSSSESFLLEQPKEEASKVLDYVGKEMELL